MDLEALYSIKEYSIIENITMKELNLESHFFWIVQDLARHIYKSVFSKTESDRIIHKNYLKILIGTILNETLE